MERLRYSRGLHLGASTLTVPPSSSHAASRSGSKQLCYFWLLLDSCPYRYGSVLRDSSTPARWQTRCRAFARTCTAAVFAAAPAAVASRPTLDRRFAVLVVGPSGQRRAILSLPNRSCSVHQDEPERERSRASSSRGAACSCYLPLPLPSRRLQPFYTHSPAQSPARANCACLGAVLVRYRRRLREVRERCPPASSRVTAPSLSQSPETKSFYRAAFVPIARVLR
ncbi:hypothetical protein BD414DRAFT_46059 [Trametes punicea]|nr:hypothetical protein BD414DRAFT_46059 [Trametes punicea]